MNYDAEELQLHEAEQIRADPAASARVLKSYEMMLDFYGLRLKDPKTGKSNALNPGYLLSAFFYGLAYCCVGGVMSSGEVERHSNYKPCFRNLNRSSHNYLRITRILKVFICIVASVCVPLCVIV